MQPLQSDFATADELCGRMPTKDRWDRPGLSWARASSCGMMASAMTGAQRPQFPHIGASSMHVLITGGAGFIGANFVHQTLVRHPDATVTVLDSSPTPGTRARWPTWMTVSRWSSGTSPTPTSSTRSWPRPTSSSTSRPSHTMTTPLRDPSPFIQTNLVGTFTLLEAVRRHKVRFHHISTDEVYGDLELDDPAKFEPTTPYNPSSPYSSSKAGSDLLVRT